MFYQLNGVSFYMAEMRPIELSEYRYHWRVWLVVHRDFVDLDTGIDDYYRAFKDKYLHPR